MNMEYTGNVKHSGIDKECTTAAAVVRVLVVKFLEVHT